MTNTANLAARLQDLVTRSAASDLAAAAALAELQAAGLAVAAAMDALANATGAQS